MNSTNTVFSISPYNSSITWQKIALLEQKHPNLGKKAQNVPCAVAQVAGYFLYEKLWESLDAKNGISGKALLRF